MFFLDVPQKHAADPNHASKRRTQVPTTKLYFLHLQGCSCVLKRPPTLPMRKDTHCIVKRFGNLPLSFRSLVFFLGSITVRSLELVSVDKCFRNFREFDPVKARKTEYLKNYYLFPENIPLGRNVPFELFPGLPKILFKW